MMILLIVRSARGLHSSDVFYMWFETLQNEVINKTRE
jgi:hypothetical protein